MKRRIIPSTASLRDGLQALQLLSGGVLTLLVTDSNERLLGTLTDGDIRRALLKGVALTDPVTDAMNRKFHALDADNIDVSTLSDYRSKGFRLIPVIDAEGRIVDLVDTSATHTVLPLRAIVMAGGRGERLRPLTLSTPKPLLPVGGKAIIDYNIAMLASAGIRDITVTTHYLAEMLEAHFSRPVAGVEVKCVREVKPMGTMGAVTLTDIPEHGFTLVMNSDLLTSISLEQMWLSHLRAKADITVATTPHTVAVPFAVLSTEGDHVTGLVEKPTYTFQANAGIYIISNEILRSIDPDAHTDATDIIEQAIDRGRKVATYPINGLWIDIGSPDDYRQAQELMGYHNCLSGK